MSIYDKHIKYIDVNLLSGSRDKFRNEIGLYYHEDTIDPDWFTGSYLTYDSFDALERNNIRSNVETYNGQSSHEVPRSNIISFIQTQMRYDMMTTSSADLIFDSKRIPIRVIGDETKIVNDAQWKAMVLGGNYSTASYPGFYTAETFNDYSYTLKTPYSVTEVKKMAAHSPLISAHDAFSYYEIAYRYKMHLKKYEEKAARTHTKMLPNMYMLKMIDDNEDPEANFPEYLRNFVSIEGEYSDITNGNLEDSLFQPTLNSYPPPDTTQTMVLSSFGPGTYLYEDKSEKLRDYLNINFAESEYTDETIDQVKNSTQTLYYNSDFTDKWFSGIYESDPDAVINKFPMYTRVTLPIQPTKHRYSTTYMITVPTIVDGDWETREVPITMWHDTYTSIIKDNKLENEFLISLDKMFTPNNTEILNYVQETAYLTGGAGGDVSLASKTKNKSFAARDYMDILKDMYKRAEYPDTIDGLIMGQKSLNKDSAKNFGAKYRYSTTMKVMKSMQDTIDLVNDTPLLSETSEYPELQLLMHDLKVMHGTTPGATEPETIAYRIKKTEGRTRGSERTITDTQNIYFINNNSLTVDGSNLVYYDTQVKHGHDYQYKLYAYVIVPGYEYKYSDLRISRKIGNVVDVTTAVSSDTAAPGLDPERYCLEFYNANTGLAASQLLNSETNLGGTIYTPIESADAFAAWEAALDAGITFGEIDDKYVSEVDFVGEDVLFAFGSIHASVAVRSYLTSLLITLIPFEDAEARYLEIYNRLFSEWASTMLEVEHAGKTVVVAAPAANRYASNAQIKSSNPYLADFYFHWMPSVRVMEIPIGIDSVRIMDNPPVACDITPYQRKDDSQIIGFYINVESFKLHPYPTNTDSMSNIGMYPTPLNKVEQAKKGVYLDSNNMLTNELINHNSVTKVSKLEVYRLDKEPHSITEFENNLVYTKDLSMEYEPDEKYTNCFYEEKVQTNRKYYYLFRFLNEHGDAGYLSPIQVAELVDDGGYKYSTFDVIFETDLEKDPDRQDSIPMKKLLQVSPAMSHIGINDETADYGQPAATQVDAIRSKIGTATELIWGKTFKFRLTSKKTGRKIDFNIKYNLREL